MEQVSQSRRAKRRADVTGGNVDIRLIARLANVSTATVSRTMNGSAVVAPERASRVLKAIEETGYCPNTQARALGSGRSRILGLIVSEITNPFFPELIQGFENAAIEHGYEVLISSTNSDTGRMAHCVRRMLERHVDGLAFMTFGIEEPLLDQLAQLSQRRIPLTFIDVGPDRPRVSLLQVDYKSGIRKGVQHLVALGHKDIAFVAGTPGLHSSRSRLDAFSTSLAECGIPPNPARILQGDYTWDGGIGAMKRLLGTRDLPTAIMCSNDMTAIGVLHAAYRAGLRVPDDLSIIGFDNIHIAKVTTPPLTTVEMSGLALANSAVAELHAQLDAPHDSPCKRQISTDLIVRESTGVPRAALEHPRIQRTTWPTQIEPKRPRIAIPAKTMMADNARQSAT